MSYLFERISAATPSSMTRLAEAYDIRNQIFIEEQGIPADLDHDGKDEISEHVLVREAKDGIAIGTGRMTPTSDSVGVLARIAVLPAHRGKGLGRQIIKQLESYAIDLNISTLALSPHEHLEAFYQSLGYEVIQGKEEQVGKYRLIKMQKTLPTQI